jgi:hypothetical protein
MTGGRERWGEAGPEASAPVRAAGDEEQRSEEEGAHRRAGFSGERRDSEKLSRPPGAPSGALRGRPRHAPQPQRASCSAAVVVMETMEGRQGDDSAGVDPGGDGAGWNELIQTLWGRASLKYRPYSARTVSKCRSLADGERQGLRAPSRFLVRRMIVRSLASTRPCAWPSSVVGAGTTVAFQLPLSAGGPPRLPGRAGGDDALARRARLPT